MLGIMLILTRVGKKTHAVQPKSLLVLTLTDNQVYAAENYGDESNVFETTNEDSSSEIEDDLNVINKLEMTVTLTPPKYTKVGASVKVK